MINDKFNPYVYIVACVYIEYVWLPKGKSPDPLGIPFAPICHYLATSCLTDSNEGLPSSKRRGSSTPVAEAIWGQGRLQIWWSSSLESSQIFVEILQAMDLVEVVALWTTGVMIPKMDIWTPVVHHSNTSNTSNQVVTYYILLWLPNVVN